MPLFGLMCIHMSVVIHSIHLAGDGSETTATDVFLELTETIVRVEDERRDLIKESASFRKAYSDIQRDMDLVAIMTYIHVSIMSLEYGAHSPLALCLYMECRTTAGTITA